MIKRALDVGARSLLVPFVQNAEEARCAVAAALYPPRGIRGVALVPRANQYGRIQNYHPNAHPTPASWCRWRRGQVAWSDKDAVTPSTVAMASI